MYVKPRGISLNLVSVLLGFQSLNASLFTAAVGAVVTVGKPERSLQRLFQAAVEILKKKPPKASLTRFPLLRQFPQRLAAGFSRRLQEWKALSRVPYEASPGMPIVVYRQSWRGLFQVRASLFVSG